MATVHGWVSVFSRVQQRRWPHGQRGVRRMRVERRGGERDGENKELGEWGIGVRYQGIRLERGLGEQKGDRGR